MQLLAIFNPFWSWGFALAGVLLASIPIIIHLLNRRRFKIVLWAAMEYLLQAMRKNRRRLRFEQWLLLAVRCLLLILLGLALAQPILGCDRSWALLGAQKVGLNVIIIDNSFPMAYEGNRPGAKTHFDQAKIAARQIIDRLSDNECVSIITTATPARPVMEKPSYDMARAKEAIDRIEQSFAAPDMASALQTAVAIAKENEKQPRKVLYMVTDWARCTFGEKGPQAEAIRQAAMDVSKLYRSPVVFNLGRPDQWNNAIIDIKPSANLVTTKFPVELAATARHFGPGAPSQLVWRIDGKDEGGESLTLEGSPVTKVRPNTQIKEGGAHVISAEINTPNESLKADNIRYRVMDVASELKVLIVEGERGVGALQGSGSFLELALAPPKEGAAGGSTSSRTDSYVGADVISDVELGNKVLGDYRAIILTNVEQIPEAEATRLAAFVKQGGTLLVFMGERVNGEIYNRILLPKGLMPGKLIARKEDRATATTDAKGFTFDFNPKGVLHPILREFANVTTSGLDTARVYTYYQCELPPESRAEVVLHYIDLEGKVTKDPAITIHSLEKGRVVFVSTTANADWTSFPAKPAYPALMHEMLAGTVNVGDRWLNLIVGQPLDVPARLKLAAAPKLIDAQKREILLETARDPDGLEVYRSKPLTRPGIYLLHTGAKTYPVAVNVAPETADIRTIKEAQFRKAMGDIDMVVQSELVTGEALSRNDANELGWILMLALLALIGLECFLAMRFGHYRRLGAAVSGPQVPEGATSMPHGIPSAFPQGPALVGHSGPIFTPPVPAGGGTGGTVGTASRT